MKMMRSKLYEYELDKKKAATRKIEDTKLETGSDRRSEATSCSHTAWRRTTHARGGGDVTACSMAIWSHLYAAT